VTITKTRATDPCPPPLTGGQKKEIGTEKAAKVSIDWLALTFHVERSSTYVDIDGAVTWFNRLDPIKRAVWVGTGFEMSEWVELEYGLNGYLNSAVGPGGARLLWNAAGRTDVHLILPGKACAMFSENTMRSFISWANERNASATRCDLNLDDYAKVVTPLQVETYAQGPDIVTHVHRGMTQRGFGIGTKETTGVTVYIGQPSSRQRLRVYDKGLESNGEIDAVRWELTSQKEAAQTLLLRLGSDRTGKPLREWGELFSERLVSFVDFRIATDDLYDLRNRRRCPWFVKLVKLAEKASSYLPKLPRKIDDVVNWVTKAVGPSLKMLATFWEDSKPLHYTGNGIIDDIIRGSELKPKHRAILARSG